MVAPLKIEEIIATNPGVDPQKLQRFREMQQVLEQAGVVRKADYRLSPPLGGTPSKPFLPINGSIRLT